MDVVGEGEGEVVGEAGGDIVEGGGEDVVKDGGGGIVEGEGEDVVEGRGGDVVEGWDMAMGELQSSRGDGTSGATTSVSGSIIPLTVTCNGFTITPVTDDWSVAEPTSHQFTYTKTPGPTSAAICSGNQTAGDLFCRFFTEEVWDLIVSETNGHAETFVSTTPTNRPWVSVSVP